MFVSLNDIKISSAALYYLVVEQFYGEHDLGYDIYTKHKDKRCLSRFLHLIRSFDQHGWIADYKLTNADILWWFYSNPGRTSFDANCHHDRVFLTPVHDILNGKHRIAIATWHRVSEIPCIIDERYTELDNVDTFTNTEKEIIDEAAKRMHSR